MQPTAPVSTTSQIPIPTIASNEPVAVIPIASVAPLDGPPDGERINTFALAPKDNDQALGHSAENALGKIRGRVLGKPLTYLAAAFSFGFVLARALR